VVSESGEARPGWYRSWIAGPFAMLSAAAWFPLFLLWGFVGYWPIEAVCGLAVALNVCLAFAYMDRAGRVRSRVAMGVTDGLLVVQAIAFAVLCAWFMRT